MAKDKESKDSPRSAKELALVQAALLYTALQNTYFFLDENYGPTKETTVNPTTSKAPKPTTNPSSYTKLLGIATKILDIATFNKLYRFPIIFAAGFIEGFHSSKTLTPEQSLLKEAMDKAYTELRGLENITQEFQESYDSIMRKIKYLEANLEKGGVGEQLFHSPTDKTEDALAFLARNIILKHGSEAEKTFLGLTDKFRGIVIAGESVLIKHLYQIASLCGDIIGKSVKQKSPRVLMSTANALYPTVAALAFIATKGYENFSKVTSLISDHEDFSKVTSLIPSFKNFEKVINLIPKKILKFLFIAAADGVVSGHLPITQQQQQQQPEAPKQTEDVTEKPKTTVDCILSSFDQVVAQYPKFAQELSRATQYATETTTNTRDKVTEKGPGGIIGKDAKKSKGVLDYLIQFLAKDSTITDEARKVQAKLTGIARTFSAKTYDITKAFTKDVAEKAPTALSKALQSIKSAAKSMRKTLVKTSRQESNREGIVRKVRKKHKGHTH